MMLFFYIFAAMVLHFLLLFVFHLYFLEHTIISAGAILVDIASASSEGSDEYVHLHELHGLPGAFATCIH